MAQVIEVYCFVTSPQFVFFCEVEKKVYLKSRYVYIIMFTMQKINGTDFYMDYLKFLIV